MIKAEGEDEILLDNVGSFKNAIPVQESSNQQPYAILW